MKKILSVLGIALLAGTLGANGQVNRERRCGAQQLHQQMIANDPSWLEKFKAQQNGIEEKAQQYLQSQEMNQLGKTTGISAVPVIFHIVVDTAQYLSMGGATGIAKRCDSQIVILNRDFNRQNPDSTLIPTGWKSLYGNAGIRFALARRTPAGICTPGYEIKIITSTGYSNINDAFPEAKVASTGLASWDVNKYYNVWCINFIGAAASLLGITQPKSFTTPGTVNETGVCILYNTLGKGGTGTGTFNPPYDKGRTLTHETGHFFEIWHPWGDDGGSCPTWSSTSGTCSSGIGQDDGISDTPPESDATYGAPAYTITGGTVSDCCQMNGVTNTQPIGIACLSYMDYTNDAAMYMFTKLQAAAMASTIIPTTSTYYSLTQNPSLLVCPGTLVETMETGSTLNVYPNPTSGLINVTVNASAEVLNEIAVLNVLGQEVTTVKGAARDNYTIDLSGMSKGLYSVRFTFATGTVTRKVVVQ